MQITLNAEHIAYYWLVASMVFLALEAFGISGVGFLFAGLAAVCVGILIELDVISRFDMVEQFATFFGATTVCALLLWKPLKRWYSNKEGRAYSNIVGTMAKVTSPEGLRKGSLGEVKWSGTTMQAELTMESPKMHIAEGEMVVVVSVKGSKLVVAPHG